ncbi:MAG: polysulfide reductase NrfD [Chloroflexi bacterium]|nr:polysulfide reductase NrfD [Chloroflexota bacterium]
MSKESRSAPRPAEPDQALALEMRPGILSDQLLLDPRPVGDMNRYIMEAMQRTGKGFWILVAILASLVLIGYGGAWGYQVRWGMGVAGIRRPVFWGLYIANFVFWIGISHSGTFISAVLRVFKAEFRRPITRGSEMMTTFSLIVAGLFPLIHLGRTWRFYWMIPYFNQRQLWPNFHSPLMWDMMAIFTYLTGSTLYLYLPLIPDMAMARNITTGWRKRVYGTLALGWRGSESEWHHLKTAIKIFAFVIMPVMFSVHTIVSWDFGMTLVEGWHSTIFGPYFVTGAIFSGVSAVITVLLIVRKTMKLDYFLRPEHFDALGKLILVFSFAWTYFWFAEFITEWYGGEPVISALIHMQARGPVAVLWYTMLFFNIVVPWSTLWNRRIRRSTTAMLLITIGINIGMYLERYIIVATFLTKGRMPFNWGIYNPSIVELLISIGALSLFALLYVVASRLIPLVPVWEVQEGQLSHSLRPIGRALVPSVVDLE